MAAFKRTKEPGNELVLKSGDGERRLKKIEQTLLDDLDIEEPTRTLKLQARRVAELALVAEELAAQFASGKPISIELMGRNTDRLGRAMKELRDQAVRIRIGESNARAHAAASMPDDDDDDGAIDFATVGRLTRSRKERPIRRVIANGG